MTERAVSYKEQVELFNSKVQEFINIISEDPMPTRALHPDVSHILNAMHLNIDTQYYSISYFYEGLKNTTQIKKGTQENIHFLWFVILCVFKEKLLNNSVKSISDKDYECMENVLFSPHTCTIKTIGREKQVSLKVEKYERLFVTDVLPYLIQQNEINTLSNKLDTPKSTFQKMSEELNTQEKKIDEKIQQYQQKADDLVKFIKEQNTKLNFVGLGSAFQAIDKEKRIAKNLIIFFLFVIFLSLLGIPLLTYKKIYCIEQPNYFMAIPFTVIEFILLYVFRLFYQQYLFVKSELLQISLRHNLCAFIEDYMEFKKGNKDNTVDLFEQLIFSNIISDEKKVPATVDGLESIANIIQAIKNK